MQPVDPTHINWLTLFLPFLFTLFVFGLTRFLDFRRVQLQIKKELIRNQIFVNKWIEWVDAQVVKQIKHLNSLVENLKSDKFENFTQINLHYDKLSLISSKDRLSLFCINRKGDENKLTSTFFEFENNAEQLNSTQRNLEKAFDYYRKSIFKVFEEWDENMHDLNESIDRLILSPQENTKIKLIIQELLNLVRSHIGKNGIPIPQLKISLIDPTSNLLAQLYNIREPDDFFFLSGRTIRKLNVLTTEYKNSKVTALKQFNDLSNSLSETIFKLKAANTEISKCKMKYFLLLK